jgi:type I restriction enzyme S subunit
MKSSWPSVKLGEVLRPRTEFIKIDDITTYKRPRVRLHAQGIVLRDEVPGALIKTKMQQVCRTGEFLIAEIDAKVGGFGIVPEALNNAIVSNHYFLFDINEGKLDRCFFDLFSRTPEFFAQIAAQGSTNYAAIRSAHILRYKMPLPPLAEQRRIVARIEGLAAQINEASTLRQQGIEQIDALFEALVEKRLSDSEKYPEEYLGKLASKIGSGSTPPGGRAAYPSFGIPFIRSLNVRMRRFQWENIAYISPETHNRMVGTRVRPNDVLLNITGASIGRVACAPTDLSEANVNQHVTIIRLSDEIVHPRFLMYWLSQATVQTFINDMQKGATRQGFTKSQIEEFRVPVPPLIEQRRIVAELDALQAEADALKRLQAETAAELNALLPSILDRAFKGEL